MNRMRYVHEGGTNNLLAQYSWDALSRAQSIAYGDGTSDAYSQYDTGDNLKTMTQTYNGSNNSVTFNYTWLMNHQLNSAGVNNPLFQYVPQAGTVSYGAANADNGLTTVGGASMTYDGNQNLTYDGTNTLSYDVENRLIAAQNAAWGASTYLYDPLGERKEKSVGVNTAMPVATDFVLAGGEEIADYYESSASWRLTVRGAGGLPLVTVVPAAGGGSEEIVYVHHDVKGSTVALTEAGSNGPAEIYTYSDYGQPQSGTWLAYQYAGYRYDSETGLYYTPARSYSPVLGRFLQSDPVGFHGGLNMYAYAGNDPFNLVDPTGLTPDGAGAIKVTESTTVDTYFMRALGINTVNVSATSTQIYDLVPYQLIIIPGETERLISQSIFHYELVNKEGHKLTGAYGLEEHLWKDPAATQHMAVKINSEGKFAAQTAQGEYTDTVGPTSFQVGLRTGDFEDYQTFSVSYNGAITNLSTEFEHITDVVGLDIFNNVIDIKP